MSHTTSVSVALQCFRFLVILRSMCAISWYKRKMMIKLDVKDPSHLIGSEGAALPLRVVQDRSLEMLGVATISLSKQVIHRSQILLPGCNLDICAATVTN